LSPVQQENSPDKRLPVTYLLAYTHERWGIVDVVLDGLSLAQTYRVQFDKIIRGSSYETLVHLMKTRAG
jgi:ABC-type transporter MlaC component